ncbi:helix-turn-helix domain-containing protein [Streptococcus ruminantium]|uniref:helix-turn-helix domain-containing protein n=1 Tax=Streptococcus ruminantium TaxID=1917441 RepID=UPI001F29335C|nr:helix-turn-helix transcriptional regulator [Streptococcus ruminantium]BDD37924.1 hypothetical protein GUT183_01620 [Streptococcus ruminantium]
MTTADKIKYILQKTGWTRDQFATEMDVSKVSVYAWLNGVAPRESRSAAIDELYEYCKRVPASAAKPSIPRVLSERGKIKLKFPWYSHQKT